MITYKLFVIVILFTTGVLSRNTHRGNIRHRQPDEDYKYNHPPEPETYEAIPVAVLYDEDSNRNDKSIKSDISTKNNVEQVTKEPPKSDSYIDNSPIPTKEDIDHLVPTPVQAQAEDQSSNGKVPDKPTATLAVQSEQEQQIPVAVVYEPEASYYNEPRPKVQRVSSKRRKVQRPQVQDEQLEKEKKIEVSVEANENIPNARVPDTQERFSSRDKSTPTSTSNARVPETQERFRSRDKNTPALTFNARVPDTQEQFNSRGKNTPAPTYNTRIPDTQEQFSSHDENTFAPTSSDQVPDTQERFKSRDKSTLAPTSNAQVPDTQERFSNSDESVPIRDFAKRDNSTRQREVVPIIQSENLVFSHTGDFQYSYEGGDGTKAFEKGQLKTFEGDNAGEAVSGGFSYTAKDGNEYSLSYTADENGYRPVGAHLPTPPPIPPAIARALAYLATKPTPEPVTESSYEADYS